LIFRSLFNRFTQGHKWVTRRHHFDQSVLSWLCVCERERESTVMQCQRGTGVGSPIDPYTVTQIRSFSLCIKHK
jgi:hypothetical protein